MIGSSLLTAEPLHHPLRLDPGQPDPQDLLRRAEANYQVEEWWTYWQKYYRESHSPSFDTADMVRGCGLVLQ